MLYNNHITHLYIYHSWNLKKKIFFHILSHVYMMMSIYTNIHPTMTIGTVFVGPHRYFTLDYLHENIVIASIAFGTQLTMVYLAVALDLSSMTSLPDRYS